MKATRKHKDNSSRQARQSSYHYRISKAVKAVAIIIGAVIGIALWAIAKPILRAVGWLISSSPQSEQYIGYSHSKTFTTMATNSMKGTQAFQDTIAQYLMARAEQDPMFAVRLANPSKTMAQCCAYIIGEVKKSGCCGFTDDEIFGWAMHFWDEPEIEVSDNIPNCQVVVNHVVELTEEEKEKARQDAINKLRDEEMAKMRRPKTTEKKAQDVQPSLFDC